MNVERLNPPLAQNVMRTVRAHLARRTLPTRRYLDRRRRQFRRLLGARDQSRVVSLRLARREGGKRPDRPRRADRHDLARVSARRPPQPALGKLGKQKEKSCLTRGGGAAIIAD